MKKNLKLLTTVFLLGALFSNVFGQIAKKHPIFAVINDGRTLEPIMMVENGKQVEFGAENQNGWEAFNKQFYKPKTAYNLIFGGLVSGKVTVTKGPENNECSPNMAMATTVSTKAKLKGMVMGLATDLTNKKGVLGTRRTPLLAERTEIEKLVRAEMTNQKVSAANLKGLRYHNLTALDVNNDKRVEFVGSYWLPTAKNERALLFFIAEKDKDGKLSLIFTNFQTVKKEEVMSGDITDLDKGIYHELLLDVFDIEGDGTAEIFTIIQAFEGNNFNVYKREADKWTRFKELYNYHCGY